MRTGPRLRGYCRTRSVQKDQDSGPIRPGRARFSIKTRTFTALEIARICQSQRRTCRYLTVKDRCESIQRIGQTPLRPYASSGWGQADVSHARAIRMQPRKLNQPYVFVAVAEKTPASNSVFFTNLHHPYPTPSTMSPRESNWVSSFPLGHHPISYAVVKLAQVLPRTGR